MILCTLIVTVCIWINKTETCFRLNRREYSGSAKLTIFGKWSYTCIHVISNLRSKRQHFTPKRPAALIRDKKWGKFNFFQSHYMKRGYIFYPHQHFFWKWLLIRWHEFPALWLTFRPSLIPEISLRIVCHPGSLVIRVSFRACAEEKEILWRMWCRALGLRPSLTASLWRIYLPSSCTFNCSEPMYRARQNYVS